MTPTQLADLQAQIDAARAELHEAQRVVALLDVDDDLTGPIAIARGVIERDLAARRVEAWTAVLDRLRREGVRVGLFDDKGRPTSPLRYSWTSDDAHVFRKCEDCGAEVWAFREGLVCSGCSRAAEDGE